MTADGVMRAAVVTVSDRAASGEREDASGPALRAALEAGDWEVISAEIVPDEATELVAALRRLADEARVPLVLTTGGTGLGPRDITPEATRSVLDREAPGLAEEARRVSREKTPFAVLSRGVAGTRGSSLIVNLPGSPRAVVEVFAALAPVLPHAVRVLVEDTKEHPSP